MYRYDIPPAGDGVLISHREARAASETMTHEAGKTLYRQKRDDTDIDDEKPALCYGLLMASIKSMTFILAQQAAMGSFSINP